MPNYLLILSGDMLLNLLSLPELDNCSIIIIEYMLAA